MAMIKLNKKVKKKRLNIKRVLIFLIIFCIFSYFINYLLNAHIENIYINNNKYIYVNNFNNKFNEQQILEIAKVDNYPKSLLLNTSSIRKNLEKNVYIKKAKVLKKGLTTLEITIYENRPLFYNESKLKTILESGEEVSDLFDIPTLINYVPDKVYSKLIEKMNSIDYSILSHISEIKYDPNDVDEERFLFSMTDGNYVYITLERFNVINKYLDIISSIGDKKGILYLDYGDHFVFE